MCILLNFYDYFIKLQLILSHSVPRRWGGGWNRVDANAWRPATTLPLNFSHRARPPWAIFNIGPDFIPFTCPPDLNLSLNGYLRVVPSRMVIDKNIYGFYTAHNRYDSVVNTSVSLVVRIETRNEKEKKHAPGVGRSILAWRLICGKFQVFLIFVSKYSKLNWESS